MGCGAAHSLIAVDTLSVKGHDEDGLGDSNFSNLRLGTGYVMLVGRGFRRTSVPYRVRYYQLSTSHPNDIWHVVCHRAVAVERRIQKSTCPFGDFTQERWGCGVSDPMVAYCMVSSSLLLVFLQGCSHTPHASGGPGLGIPWLPLHPRLASTDLIHPDMAP